MRFSCTYWCSPESCPSSLSSRTAASQQVLGRDATEGELWPDFTPSALFRFAFCSGHCWGNHCARQFQPGNSVRARSCLRLRAFGHPFGGGKTHGNVELGLYIFLGKNYLHLFIDFVCLFPVKRESSLFLLHLICPVFLPASSALERI